MCDTMVVFNRDADRRSFFAKNSDREPGELQTVHISINPKEEFKASPYLEYKENYFNGSFKKLEAIFNQFDSQYSAIISRPTWMWGAEMGVNEFGLAIGNEAVFSKEKVPADGLLGMDILRLTLHNNKRAEEAADFIINLIRKYEQGGDGGYTKPLKYFNSFLIKDPEEAFLLETSANHWALKKVETFATISNSYSLRDDFDVADEGSADIDNFKETYENKLFTYFAGGNKRQKFSSGYISEHEINLESIKNLLRSHQGSSGKIKRGMTSICMHSGRFIKSETTSSLIVDYINDKLIIWFNGSPHPCLSLYKPLILPRDKNARLDFTDMDFAVEYSKKLRILTKKLAENYDIFRKQIKPLRDKFETEFARIIYEGIEDKTEEDLVSDCQECLSLERDYLSKVHKMLN